jgi:hypothetical protein
MSSSDRSFTPSRTRKGFQRASGLVAPQLEAAAGRRGFAEARLLTHWAEIAGPDLAAVSRPVKLTRGRGHAGGTLTVLIDGAHAPAVQMLLPMLRERVNAACGHGAVERIRITQTAGGGFAEPAAPYRPAAPPSPPPERIAAVRQALSSIGDDGLRAALETLARNVLSGRSPRNRG